VHRITAISLPGSSPPFPLRVSFADLAFRTAMKKHLLNRCKNCNFAWFPRGFDLSRKCPNCGSVDVDFTGRIYLVILAALAIGAGILWGSDRPHKKAKAAATPPATPQTFMKPRHPVSTPPATPGFAPVAITNEAEGREEALRLYPDLGVPYSPLNVEFVARYNRYRRERPEYFKDPAWPVTLVKECAAAINEQSKGQ
jgi:hypothetical protein